jgi:hypothetical protein
MAAWPQPQWSPPLYGGSTGSTVAIMPRTSSPQWSPPLDGENAAAGRSHAAGHLVTAMEPAVRRRERPASPGPSCRRQREHQRDLHRAGCVVGAAREPTANRGSTLFFWEKRFVTSQPQWSPPLSDGSTVRIRRGLGLLQGAAMEPALERREHGMHKVLTCVTDDVPQCSPPWNGGSTNPNGRLLP